MSGPGSHTVIRCRCVICRTVREYTDFDKIDEAGPTCEKCFGPMVPVYIETHTSDSQETPHGS